MKVSVDRGELEAFYADIGLTWAEEAEAYLPAFMNANAPVGEPRQDRPDRGGRLAQSHHAQILGTPKHPIVRVTAQAPYSFLVHEGHGPVDPIVRYAGDDHVLRWFTNFDKVHTAFHTGPADGVPWMVDTFHELGFPIVHHVTGGTEV